MLLNKNFFFPNEYSRTSWDINLLRIIVILQKISNSGLKRINITEIYFIMVSFLS